MTYNFVVLFGYAVKHIQFLPCGKCDIILGLLEAQKAMEMLVVLFARVSNSGQTKFRLPDLCS